jgi:hypothetical protein
MQYLYVSIQLWKCDFYNFGQNNGRYYKTYYTHYFSNMSALSKCDSTSHGLINYIDTKSNCHKMSLKIDWKGTLRKLFIRVLSDSTLPPPFPVSKYRIYSVWRGGGGGCWVLLETLFCRSLTLCIWPDSEPTKLLDHPKTCRNVSLQVNFFYTDDILLWCLYS